LNPLKAVILSPKLDAKAFEDNFSDDGQSEQSCCVSDASCLAVQKFHHDAPRAERFLS
jgi:hypothetical protein